MSRAEAGQLIDSHCHIDLPQFDADRTAVIGRARAAGVRLIVNPGIDLDHCRRALTLADAIPELYVAIGVHPNSADQFDAATLTALHQLARRPKVVAIGEIGLDFHWDTVAPAVQEQAFVRQLDLAAELGLPVIIHSRDANDAVAALLRTWVAGAAFQHSRLAQRPFAGVLHAFSGDLALAEEAYTWNFVLGLGGPVTYRNARDLHALTPHLRLDRLMLETDAPYLTPHPHRGQRNEPAHVALVCAQVAQLCGATPATVAMQTTATALRFFGLEDRLGVDSTTRHVVAQL
ncbi:MAG TPA: TatD family hydrolase [Chloroflexi bacterium]|nr:TatD family hydrolase [Chloroflexota bacterium]